MLLIGDSGVGKTSLADMFRKGRISSSVHPTIAADFYKMPVKLENGQTALLQLWDTAGQERFQSIANKFYKGADCCVIVYDVTSQDSFQNCQKWYDYFLQESSGSFIGEDVPVVLVGNKADLGAKVTEETVDSHWQTLSKLRAQISAFDNEQVQALFKQIV